MIARRTFIAGLGATAAWPLAARAQQGEQVRRIGFLHPFAPGGDDDNVALVVRGLADRGWVEGCNVRFDHRWAAGDVERMQVLARELVDLKPDVLVATSSNVATRTLQAATRMIPIVFMRAGDPIASGLVANIARPEGNTTGWTDNTVSMGGKWLDLLHAAVASVERVALLFDPDLHNEATLAEIETAAAERRIAVRRLIIHDSAEIAPALKAFAAEPNGAVIPVPPIGGLPGAIEVINKAALEHRLPTMHTNSETAVNGGLMGYGTDQADMYRRVGADYVSRVLSGAKPSELPIQFPTKFVLVVNLKTAKAMGLTIPESFLLLADEVIE
jgi:putative tryptophan/tyrosine transport system substrate-binding protein